MLGSQGGMDLRFKKCVIARPDRVVCAWARAGEGAEAAMRTHLLRQREALRDLTRNQRSRVAA